MITLTRLIRTGILLLMVSYATFGVELTEEQRIKLHPFFQSVVAKSFPQLLKTTTTWNRQGLSIANDGSSLYDAIVYTRDAQTLRSMGIQVHSVLPEFVTAQLTPSDITRLAALESVRYLDPGTRNYPLLDLSIPESGTALLHSGFINNTPYKGNGTIVLIYDTGIDWKHLDFRKSDTTKSRILCIWDQTITKGTGEVSPTGFSYGVEYTQAHIENEIDGTPTGYVRQRDINGHGTHVASTAAGNGLSYNGKYIGVAPEADIIVVKGGDNSFSETNMIDCLTYAQNKATVYGKPIAINWSIGGQSGPHDGTRPYEVAVDNFVLNPGRVVCISAGNDGGRNIHVNGTVSSSDSSTFNITVPIYTPNAGTDDDYFYMDIWFAGSETITVTVTSPTGMPYITSTTGTGPINTDGTIDVGNYTSASNSKRNIQVYVHDATANVPKTGPWTIALSKTGASTASFDGWLAGSDLGGASATLPGGNTNKTVAMPGTSREAITVGSYTTRPIWYSYNGGGWQWGLQDNISSFSSIGPTADNRQKPDIAAPGQMIVASLSSSVDTTGEASDIVQGQKHQVMAGTSMASPHVAGGAALLLGANPSLSSSQIKNLFTSTANSDAFATGLPNNIWGYGKFDIVEAMAKSLSSGAIVTRTTLAYDGTGTNTTQRITGSTKIAVRYSPFVSGTLTGVQLNVTTPINRPIVGSGSLVCQVYANNGGTPGTTIGGPVNHPLNLLSAGTNNYINMRNADTEINSGADYFIVMSVANPSDTVIVRAEDVTTGTHSYTNNGSTWSAQTYNLRIRSIIVSTSGLNNADVVQMQSDVFYLSQNYPNPFNPTTTIEYQITPSSFDPAKSAGRWETRKGERGGFVSLKVYDVLGREVATLVNEEKAPGIYTITWDASKNASGIYFYRISAGAFSQTNRMILLK